MALNSKTPQGPLEKKWTNYKSTCKLVNPSNKRQIEIIVVGTGLAGASAAASLGELGYKVKAFCYQDSPRRAHSIAAQGGINAAKNYQNDGDSVYRLFYDTIKGGDYRAREGNVYRLAEVSSAVLLCTGGYGNVFYLSTNAMGCNATAVWKAHKQGAYFGNPCFTQIHPTCIPVSGDHQSKLTLMSESLRNDGRIWVSKIKGDTRKPGDIPEDERDYYLERRYPAFGNLVPRDVASRAAKERCDAGYGVGASKQAVYLDFAYAINRYGKIEVHKPYTGLERMW